MFRSLEIFQLGNLDLVSPRADKDVAGIMDLVLSATKLAQNRLQTRIITLFTFDLTLCIGSESQISSKMQSVQQMDHLNTKECHTYKRIRSHPEKEH